MDKNLLNIFVLAFGVCVGLFLYFWWADGVLKNACLLDSNKCYRIYYKKKNNTVLIKLPNSYWIWFNGAEFFVYGYPSSTECPSITNSKGEVTSQSSAFVINSQNLDIRGYRCVKSLEAVKDIYKKMDDTYHYINMKQCYKQTDRKKCGEHIGCGPAAEVSDKACGKIPIGAIAIIDEFIKKRIIDKKDIQTIIYDNQTPIVQ